MQAIGCTASRTRHLVLESEQRWIWDSWIADDGEAFHLFHLQAPRSLGDPIPVELDEGYVVAASC